MRKGYLFSLTLFITCKLSAQYPLTLIPYLQNFNGLGTGSSMVAGGDLSLVSASLNDWYFSETLSGADITITAGDGSNITGDTYNFGSTAAPDRTLGGLQSGNLNPTIGFYVTNNTGSTITSLTINYTGEQWRLGTAGRVDRMDFQYCQDAISLTTGNWINADALDFTAPVTTGPTGALNGNLATNRTLVTSTIIGLYIPNGANFFIRWNDFNAAGFEDGLGVDDFSLTAGILPSSTDYFRSVQSGSWADLLTWESSSDNMNWAAATAIPNSAANTISIRNGHIVNFSSFLPLDQVIIESGGILDFSTGILTVEDGIGHDIDIQSGGALVLSSANNPPAFTGLTPTVNIQGSGILRVSATGLTLTPGAGVHAVNYVYNHQSNLEHTLTTPFGTNGVTYFPNAAAGVIPVFRITQNIGLSVGSASSTIINGIFEANGNVTFAASGTKTFRNGIRGTGNISESSSGKFIINGLTAELGGTGSLTVPVAGGLEIGSGTTVTMISDKIITGNVTLLNSGSLIELGNNNLTVTGTIGITQVTSYVKTNGTGKLTIPILIAGIPGSKLFPIGRTSINPLFISSGNPANYSARIVEPITPPIYADQQAVLRTWYITSSVSTPAATISFGYSYPGVPGECGTLYNNNGPAEAGVNISGTWNIHQTGLTPAAFIFVPGTFTVTPSIPINYFNNPITEFPFVIANNFAILPIDCIVSCRSKKINNSGFISWDINSCAEVNSFEVQRSENGGAYQTIGRVIPGTQLDYNYTDASLAGGTNLYRIKVNRSSGGIKYSNTVAIINDTKGILITALSPNPVIDNATLIINGAKAGAVNFIIYDIMGRPLRQWQSFITEGSNSINVNATGLAGGIYHLAATNGDSKTVIRFVKE
jgi:hypothetical protein